MPSTGLLVRRFATSATERPAVRTGSQPRRSSRLMIRRRTETLDAYTRKARLGPALLSAVPALMVLGASMAAESAVRVLGVAVGALGVAVCGFVRDRGRQLEPGLWASWGGNPTVRRLRWRDAEDEGAVRRLHARLNAFLDNPLPDARTEAESPAGADRRYGEAVASLRERTRDVSRYRLVLAENAEYGFRRNALGLRPVALTMAAAVLAPSVGLLIWGSGDFDNRAVRWGSTAAISVGLLLYWWRIFTEQWVRRSAERYADRLFAAVETLPADPRS